MPANTWPRGLSLKSDINPWQTSPSPQIQGFLLQIIYVSTGNFLKHMLKEDNADKTVVLKGKNYDKSILNTISRLLTGSLSSATQYPETSTPGMTECQDVKIMH